MRGFVAFVLLCFREMGKQSQNTLNKKELNKMKVHIKKVLCLTLAVIFLLIAAIPSIGMDSTTAISELISNEEEIGEALHLHEPEELYYFRSMERKDDWIGIEATSFANQSTGLHVSSLGQDSVTLHWSAPANTDNIVEYYLLIFCYNTGVPQQERWLGSGERQVQITGLRAGTYYKFQVIPSYSWGWGTWSDWGNFRTVDQVHTPTTELSTIPHPRGPQIFVSTNGNIHGPVRYHRFTVQQPPPPPTNVHVPVNTIGSTTAIVHWNHSYGSTNYTVRLYRPGVSILLFNTYGANWLQLTNLAPNTLYFVDVRATNAVGESEWSSSFDSFWTAPLPTPQNPVISDITSTTANVSWNHSTGSCNTGYWVRFYRVSPSLVRAEITESWVTSVQLTNLTPNSLYFVDIMAFTENGQSDWVLIGSFWTAPLQPPHSLGVGNVTSTTATFVWTPSPGSDAFLIELYATGVIHTWIDAPFPYRHLDGLRPNTQYWFRVHGRTNYGAWGDASGWFSFWTAEETVNVHFICWRNGQWTHIAPTQTVARGTTVGEMDFPLVTKPGYRFEFWMYYNDDSVSSDFQEFRMERDTTWYAVWERIIPLPSSPTNLHVSDRTTTSATLNWSAPTVGVPILSYQVDIWCFVAGGIIRQYVLHNTNSHVVSNLVAGRDYSFNVSARNASGWGVWSGWQNFRTLEPINVTIHNLPAYHYFIHNPVNNFLGSSSQTSTPNAVNMHSFIYNVDNIGQQQQQQLWQFVFVSSGVFLVRNVRTGQYLTATNNTTVTLSHRTGSNQQHWRLLRNPQGFYMLRNVSNNRYLAGTNNNPTLIASANANSNWIVRPLTINVDVLVDQAYINQHGGWERARDRVNAINHGRTPSGQQMAQLMRTQYGIRLRFDAPRMFNSLPETAPCAQRHNSLALCHNLGHHNCVTGFVCPLRACNPSICRPTYCIETHTGVFSCEWIWSIDQACLNGHHHKSIQEMMEALPNGTIDNINSQSVNLLFTGHRVCFMMQEHMYGVTGLARFGGSIAVVSMVNAEPDHQTIEHERLIVLHELLHLFNVRHCRAECIMTSINQNNINFFTYINCLSICNSCSNTLNRNAHRFVNHR